MDIFVLAEESCLFVLAPMEMCVAYSMGCSFLFPHVADPIAGFEGKVVQM